jgi:hypothetical protein
MNRAEQTSFAWALADVAKPFIGKDVRAWVHAAIGAGDLEVAIRIVLDGFLRTNRRLPCELTAQMRTWVAGYSGSEIEVRLHWLADQVAPWGIDGDQPREDGLACTFRHEDPDAPMDRSFGGAGAVDLTPLQDVRSTSATA